MRYTISLYKEENKLIYFIQFFPMFKELERIRDEYVRSLIF